MFYPLKFEPVYKDYIWGGRNLERLGKVLPESIVAESWEVSCHNDGMSVISNGEFKGTRLEDLIRTYGRQVLGTSLPEKYLNRFPLLIKFIDANDRLSVQVHPDDSYAYSHENGENGKNEMWYIVSAEEGASLVYGIRPGADKETFRKALEEDKLEGCLNVVAVKAGDVINIPAGLVHAIGKGIVLVEIQQNSNATYRVYDYGRVDTNGNKRPLHIEKALDIINFNSYGFRDKFTGLSEEICGGCVKRYLAATMHYAAELYDLSGVIHENTAGEKFHIFTFLKGEGRIIWDHKGMTVKMGESVLIPAAVGKYTLEGRLEAIKSYIPDIMKDFIDLLLKAGYNADDIESNVGGINLKGA